MQVTIDAAKTQLSNLIEAALGGEEVVIARGNKPVVRLVPVTAKTFTFDLLSKELPGPGPDFLEPLDERNLILWEGGGAQRS